MSYTTTQLSQMTGYSSSGVTTNLDKAGYKPLDIGDHGLKIWADECLDVLLEKRNTPVVKEEIGIGMVAAKFKLTRGCIREIAKKYNIEPICYKKHMEVYPYCIYDIVKNHLDITKVENEDEHPLVTDKRFLRVDFFPDVTPKCFEDL